VLSRCRSSVPFARLALLAACLGFGGAGCDEAEPARTRGVAASASTATAAAAASGGAAPSASTAQADAAAEPPLPPLAEAPGWGERTEWSGSLDEQNELLFEQLGYVHQLDDQQMAALRAIFAGSKRLGQGNPRNSVHPGSPAACLEQLRSQGVDHDSEPFRRICGARFMAPLIDPSNQRPEDAKACIDQFEFPNIPCVYPVTWVSAREAVLLCQAQGKRLCDAHEWEGGCAGELAPPDYDFDRIRTMAAEDARRRMRANHNLREDQRPVWAYGPAYRKGVCATGSKKSKSCGVGWKRCGTNTYPAGHFLECQSRLGVFDLHGNAAEHMNLPLRPEQMACAPGGKYGYTEMKGSWFIFDRYKAHEDHCRWRAPDWHGTRVMSKGSHRNYHLGFRCCKSLE